TPALFCRPRRTPQSTLFPYTTLFRSHGNGYADVDVKKAINRGLFPGPRLQVSTMGLVRSGQAADTNPDVSLPARYTQVNGPWERSEEHTSELQSLAYLVCRLLLEKKN